MNTPGRILVADDDAVFRASLLGFLRREGHRCDDAPDAKSAIERLRSGIYDLLISDIDMPGNERLQMIEELAIRPSKVAIILVTGWPALETARRSVSLPVHAYLTKPPDLPELRKEVNDAITRQRLSGEVRHFRALLNDSPPGDGKPGNDDPPVIHHLEKCVPQLAQILCAGNEENVSAHLSGMKTRELIEGIVDAITVLESTKKAFKSKQLGALRKRLCALLDAEEAPSRVATLGGSFPPVV